MPPLRRGAGGRRFWIFKANGTPSCWVNTAAGVLQIEEPDENPPAPVPRKVGDTFTCDRYLRGVGCHSAAGYDDNTSGKRGRTVCTSCQRADYRVNRKRKAAPAAPAAAPADPADPADLPK